MNIESNIRPQYLPPILLVASVEVMCNGGRPKDSLEASIETGHVHTTVHTHVAVIQTAASDREFGAPLAATTNDKALQAFAEKRASYISLHLATVCATFSGDGVSPAKRAAYNLASLLLVIVQVCVAVAVTNGASANTCSLNRHCFGSRVCVPDVMWYTAVPEAKACFNCGDGPGLYATAVYREQVRLGDGGASFECPPADDVCAQCIDHASGSFSNYTFQDEIVDNFTAMQYKDWLALMLSSVILGLQISGEVEDILRCEITRKQFVRSGVCTKSYRLWVWLEQFTGILRRFGLLSLICVGSYTLIAYRGGDALSICLNTVALTFLLQCDNLICTHALSDSERAAAYTKMLALEHAGADDAALVAWAKCAYSVWVPTVMLVGGGLSLFGRVIFFSIIDGSLAIGFLLAILPAAESQLRGRVNECGRMRSMFLLLGQAFIGNAIAHGISSYF